VVARDELNVERKDATDATASRNRTARRQLDFSDTTDFELARRGHLASPTQRTIAGRLGQPLWNLDDYAFLEEPASRDDPPLTVNPSLWRQGRLNNIAGLFEVTPRIFQVRGLDISNVTFIAGEGGWVVIDPLTGAETAAAALALVTEHLGPRPVAAVIYTHSHADHFGGIRGVVDVAASDVPIIAPAGFLEAAVSENVLAGTVMLRRATYMYGVLLPRDARGHVDTGLGKGLPALPNSGLVAPTLEVETTGTEIVLDGVRLVFQVTPGTEAPAEMNIHVPDERALCMAENCTANLHNLYTPRGAQVRDALRWSKYINQSIELFEGGYDVVFASHHWPRFGAREATAFLESQRDAYRYIHDQTLRLANHGLTMDEIAEGLELPEGLASEFFNRDYYGTVSHNSKAVYQRYLGWFDGNPAHLHRHPPEEAARRYVEYMGGADAVLERAERSFDEGDYRWVAEVLSHVVFADPSNERARLLEADALEQLGYGSESGPWRDFYLTGAQELRSGGTVLAGLTGNALAADVVAAMTVEMLVDLVGVRLNGPVAAGLDLAIDLVVTDEDERYALTVRHGAVSLRQGRGHERPTVTITASRGALARLVAANQTVEDLETAGDLEISGDRVALGELIGALDVFRFGFEIVLP
jgi:alkyl sulfatase BDS1-like metallo-beta-lactamase superfamily hydrolase